MENLYLAFKRFTFPIICSVIALSIALINAPKAQAQAAGATAVEGYAFDRERGTPLANVLIVLRVVPFTGNQLDAFATTDANGFYSFEAVFNTPGTNILHATCSTRRGVSEITQGLYQTLRSDVYVRNFYLALPRGQRTCR